MNTHKTTWSTAEGSPRRVREDVLRAILFLVKPIRWTLYAILAVLRPFVVVGLAILAAVGYAMCAFVFCFVVGSHFPMIFMLCFSTGCLGAIVLYHALMYVLVPQPS